ncbi:MAG: glycosyltransferase family 39 protein [Anaerolineae bacterium]
MKTRRSSGWRYGALLLLCLLFAQAALSIRATSLTIDEGLHIASGYTILRTGDYRLVEEHPPLIKLWLALPLVPLHGLADPTTLPAWEEAAHPTTESLPLLNMARQLLYPHIPFDQWLLPARMMSALLAVLLGAVVWRWAADLGGTSSGLFALTLLTFDPNIIAHAAVAGTDLGAAFYMCLALFCLARAVRRPLVGPTRYARLLLAGVALGLAQGAKLSALLLVPVSVVVLWVTLRKNRLRSIVLYLACAGLTLWALYGFQIGTVPGLSFPVPAASHAIPLLRLREHAAEGHAAFLLGQNSLHGWWYYFPVAFALKTPLPILLFCVWAFLAGLWRVRNKGANIPQRHWLPLALFLILYTGASLVSSLNIGYRHLLPILPFLYIGIASYISRITHHASRVTHHVTRITQYALLLWLALGTLRIAPHDLAFFNELAGGADHGWHFLADSNTDWGQAYKALARFQEEHGLGKVRLSAFIFYDPAAYGIDYEALTPLHGDTPAVFPARFNPPPGDYIISATTLDGIPLVDPEMYDWFRKREPDARIGHVLFYYHIPTPSDPGDWLAQCVVPVSPLSLEAAAEGLNRPDLQMRYFDCTQAWVYPSGGERAGWYAYYRDGDALNAFAQAQLASARLSYEQRIPRDVPPFALYEWEPRSPATLLQAVRADAVSALPAEYPPAEAEFDDRLPLTLEGPLVFLGYRFEQTSTDAQLPELWTYWEVTAPNTRPFSIMAHLLDGAGQFLASGDGLGIAPDGLVPGDIIVQRHLFAPETLPAGGALWFQVGVYWLDTMERWTVVIDSDMRITQWLLNSSE